MTNITPTKQASDLAEALEKRGIKFQIEPWDGHKHIDIRIPEAKINIEINGIQHYINPKQIIADLKRDYYSNKDGYFTFPITNQLIETHLEDIADAITQVVKESWQSPG